MLGTILVIILILIIKFWKSCQHSSKFPPGPRFPLPIVGKNSFSKDVIFEINKGCKVTHLKGLYFFYSTVSKKVGCSAFKMIYVRSINPVLLHKVASQQFWLHLIVFTTHNLS